MKRLITFSMTAISTATLALLISAPAQARDVYTDQTPPPPTGIPVAFAPA